jgi:hypothetical protein
MPHFKETIERQFDLQSKGWEGFPHELLNSRVMSFRQVGLTGERLIKLEDMERHLADRDNIFVDRAPKIIDSAKAHIARVEAVANSIRQGSAGFFLPSTAPAADSTPGDTPPS